MENDTNNNEVTTQNSNELVKTNSNQSGNNSEENRNNANDNQGANFNENVRSDACFSNENFGRQNIIQRNIALCIVFSLITCGIYAIYWMIVLNDDINSLSGHIEDPSGGMVFLFTLLTCGIYGIFWAYKMGNKVDEIRGFQNGNTGILYIILSFIGLGLVSYALMQDTINQTCYEV